MPLKKLTEVDLELAVEYSSTWVLPELDVGLPGHFEIDVHSVKFKGHEIEFAVPDWLYDHILEICEQVEAGNAD